MSRRVLRGQHEAGVIISQGLLAQLGRLGRPSPDAANRAYQPRHRLMSRRNFLLGLRANPTLHCLRLPRTSLARYLALNHRPFSANPADGAQTEIAGRVLLT